jgi:hypothetical protein
VSLSPKKYQRDEVFDIERAKRMAVRMLEAMGLTPDSVRACIKRYGAEGERATRNGLPKMRVPAIARQPCPLCGKPL